MDIKVWENEVSVDSEEIKQLWNFIERIVPDFVKDGFWMISDQMKFWRWSRQLNLIKMRKEKVENSWLPLQQVPLKQFIPILDKWSLEHDNNLQTKRANMLANASIDTQRVKNSYPEILNQLEWIEVHILEWYYDAIKDKSEKEMETTHIVKEKVLQIYKLSEKQWQIIADNLIRLRLLVMPSSKWWVSIGDSPLSLFTYDYLHLTELGIDFIKAIKF